MYNGFFRVAAAVSHVTVADPAKNAEAICSQASQLNQSHVEIAVFPEMSVTAYTCADLFHNETLLSGAIDGLRMILHASQEWDMVVVVGAPIAVNDTLYNCAVVMQRGKVLAVIPKTYIPNYNEFYEKRWWKGADSLNVTSIELFGYEVPFSPETLVNVNGVRVAVEICEDLWTPIAPSCRHALNGAEVILNLSASDALVGKYDYVRSLVTQQSARCICAYVYTSAGYGESSTDLVFDGIGLVAENGVLLNELKRWTGKPAAAISDIDIEALRRDRLHIGSFADCRKANCPDGMQEVFADIFPTEHTTLLRHVNPHPFVPANPSTLNERTTEIINIQSAGLAKRLDSTHTRSLTVGISGGLDSTLALLVAVHAFDRLGLDRKGIIGVTMPGFGTTGRTHGNAMKLMEILGVTIREISIVPAVNQHFSDIGHDPGQHDITYENAQARQRTYLLMDIANQTGGMVLGTGDLSELALGWATYNGDHMSMYGVNAGVPKTLVRHLVHWFADNYNELADVLADIIDTPISPELIPAKEDGTIRQKSEDTVGPYELHDFFLYYMLRYGFSPKRIYFLASIAFRDTYNQDIIKKWLKEFFRRFFAQQFKRSCLPDGPKVGSICLSPRGDWRMPSDASRDLWLSEIENL